MLLEFSVVGWCVVGFCAAMMGFSKTGIPGAGILVVPLLANVMPAEQSVGFLLPILALADIIAILYWRRHVDWPKLLMLLPWTFAGVGAGYFCMKTILANQKDILMPVIGGIVLVMLAVNWWRNARLSDTHKIPTYWWFAAIMGILAGMTSTMANAAGPVMVIYLLAMKLEKKEFIGTTAWFFWILNLSKMYPIIKLGLITPQSFQTDLVTLPAIVIGGVLGIYLVHKIPQKTFNVIVEVLAAITAVVLCVKPFLGG